MKFDFLPRLIETDVKSMNSLSQSGHSRRGSDTSQISVTSLTSASLSYDATPKEDIEEGLWNLWGKFINEWETLSKKRQPQLKVLFVFIYLQTVH